MAQPGTTAALDFASSPPLLPEDSFEADIPSSPLPCSSTFATGLPNRKRQLSEYDSNLSSDPLFSENPSEVGDLTDYERPRRKRMIKGPWWAVTGRQTGHEDGERVKDAERIARNFDSGVFMGSDMSEESSENGLSISHDPDPAFQHNKRMRPAPESDMVQGEALAQQIVYQCLETGKESVDLSDLGLGQLTSETLKPLHQLIRQSHNHMTEPPSEDEFTVLTPDTKLFLAGNHLACLPEELFFLGNITVLSLRNNELAEIPPSIGRLRRLQELNVAGNSIQFLPWELLPFFQSTNEGRKQITVRPNPLLQPLQISGPSPLLRERETVFESHVDAEACLEAIRLEYAEEEPLDARSQLELRLKVGRVLERRRRSNGIPGLAELNAPYEQILYLACSNVQFFHIDGKPCQQSSAPGLSMEAIVEGPQHVPSSSSTPSLFELATRSVQHNYHLDSIPDNMPRSVQRALGNASKTGRLGNRKCSTCQRPFVTARAQWVEYWYMGMSSQPHLTPETVLPFMRFACSWGCAEPSELGEFRR